MNSPNKNLKRLKIAIVYDMIYPFNIGGAELRNYETAIRLAKNHEVHLFGVKLWKGKQIIKKDGVIIHGVCRYNNLYNFKGTRTILEPIKFAIKLFKPLKKEKFDIIYTSTFPYFHCFTCKIISILRRTPLIFTWHQHWGNYWYNYLGFFQGFFGKNIEKIVKSFTNYHIAVSQTTKKDLIKARINKKNIFVSYGGVDFKKIESVKTKTKKYDVVFVGRLNHQKNVKLLIESVGLLKKEFPKIKTCIIGDGPDKQKLFHLTKELNLRNNIDFLGFLKDIKDVYRYMKLSKIFALPSLLEGFGIVVIEANACGLPVIVVNNKWNASKELIDNNGLISENNPEDFAFAIKKLLKDNKLRKKMSINSIKKSKRFDWDIISKELEDYYKSILKD